MRLPGPTHRGCRPPWARPKVMDDVGMNNALKAQYESYTQLARLLLPERYVDTKYNIPTVATLIAFEAAARHSSVSRAAEELGTSQSAISRHISRLEAAIGAKVFERRGRGVELTKWGKEYYAVVQSTLEALHSASHGHRARCPVLTIACTQEISAHLLRPIFTRLKRSLPSGVNLRILNCDYDTLSLVVPTGVDITFEYSVGRVDADSERILDERIVPVASPVCVERYWDIFSAHPRHWSDMPRLEVAGRGQCWATWMNWFAAHDCEPPHATVEPFENYLHLLEAAINGDGIAIGWNGFVDQFLRSGKLVPLRDEWLTTHVGLYAVLTPHGAKSPDARDCLRTLAALSRELGNDQGLLRIDLRHKSNSNSILQGNFRGPPRGLAARDEPWRNVGTAEWP